MKRKKKTTTTTKKWSTVSRTEMLFIILLFNVFCRSEARLYSLLLFLCIRERLCMSISVFEQCVLVCSLTYNAFKPWHMALRLLYFTHSLARSLSTIRSHLLSRTHIPYTNVIKSVPKRITQAH